MLFLKDSSKNIYKIRLGYHDNIIVGDLHSEFTTEFKPRMNTSSYVDDPYSFFNALIDVNEKEIYEGLVEIQKKFSGEGIPKVYVIKIPNVNKRTGNTGFNYNFYEEFDDSSYELYELEDYGISLIAAKGTDLKVGQEIFVVNNERPGYDAFSNGKLYAPYKIKKVLKPTELDTSRVGSIKFID